jgi:hypothetical protein
MKVIPVTYVEGREAIFDNKEPYNNLKNFQILMKGAEECFVETTLVFDSHYMCLEGMIIHETRLSPLIIISYSTHSSLDSRVYILE